MSKGVVHEHKAAALPCVVGYVQWANGRGREQGTSSRVWAASELRHNARSLAQERAASRAASASSRATSAAPSVARAHSERCRAPSERCRAPSERCRARTASDSPRAMSAGARSEYQCVRRLAIGKQQLCDERMGCAHMASDGCVRVAHGRAMRVVFALRLDRFEILI